MTEATQQQQVPPGAGDGQQQQQQAPFWHALPENMRGGTAEETLQKVMPSWQGYHQAHTTREPALEKGKPFEFEITDDKVKAHFDAKDPVVAAFADAGAELGMTKKQVNGAVQMVLGKLADSGMLADKFDPVKNATDIAAVLGFKTVDDAAKKGLQDFETQGLAWAQNVAKQKGLSETAAVELESLILTPGGVELVRMFQSGMGEKGFALGGQHSVAKTKDEVFAMINDDRYSASSSKYDPAFRKQVDEAYDRLKSQA